MLASTNKSFPGPPHGLLATNDLKQYRSIQKTIVPSLVSNHQVGNTASLAIALAEFAQYGEAYANKAVRNAKTLAASLAQEGFSVIGEKKGYTESHQVLAKTDRYMHSWEAMKALDRASIIVNPMDLKGANGLRLGTAELTRRGMGEAEMKEIAALIRKVLIDKKVPASVEAQVKELAQGFSSISYSYDEGKSPYAPLTSIGTGKSASPPGIRK
jgi:glycine hydroxymethyltransferase